MKTQFFIFLILIFLAASVVTVAAEGFSPSSLTYMIESGEELCQNVNLDSDAERITVTDGWAESSDDEWKVSDFTNSASSHGLSINYDEELSINEREPEICISGSEDGEYHGAIVFRLGEENQDSGTLGSVIQYAVWLKVIVGDQPEVTTTSSSSSGGNSGSSGATSKTNSNSDVEFKQIAGEEIEGEDWSFKDGETAEAKTQTANDGEKITYLNYLPIVILAGLIIFAGYVRFKRRKLKNQGYI